MTPLREAISQKMSETGLMEVELTFEGKNVSTEIELFEEHYWLNIIVDGQIVGDEDLGHESEYN